MFTVSNAFNDAAVSTVRQARAKVEITWTDPFIDSSILATVNTTNRISWPDQTADLIEDVTHKWAHLDGTLKPNGSFYPCPSTEVESRSYQMGWWSAVACDSSGSFSAPYPKLQIEFANRPIIGLLVNGDSAYGEYPVDFDIKIYDEDGLLLHSEIVTGNTALRWIKDISSVNIIDAAEMTLEIKKWSAASRIAKITEFYSSLVETYTSDDIIRIDILEERETSDGSLPIGNISANELDLELQNVKIVANGTTYYDPFFPSNTNSYLHSLVKKNRRIRVWIGLVLADNSIEYVPMGTFWSGDWTIDEKRVGVTTSARDRMELLRKATFSTSSIYSNTTLFDLATTVLEDAKISIPMPDLVYSIDVELKDFVIPYAYFDRKNYMQVIKDIAIACMGYAYMSKEDVLIISGPTAALS